MPVYKDENTGKWYCKFYYQDWQGKRKQKKKMGFSRRKDAKEWESHFLERQAADLNMRFSDFIDLYLEDMEHRLRYSTIITKKAIINNRILPFFGDMSINEITPPQIRSWQNELTSYKSEKGKPFSQTYLKAVCDQMVNIMNYAVKYYNLAANPCLKAGSIGRQRRDSIDFWTLEEFERFIGFFKDDIEPTLVFTALYYTGARIGELLALTPNDIDLHAGTISITKTYQRRDKKDIITPPKTKKSNRVISVPPFLRDMFKDYMDRIYGLHDNDRILQSNKWIIEKWIKKGCEGAGVKKIRIHDLRHSHASLLIELGFSPLLIAERLGHESIETTLNTYSHLYPNKQDEVASKLEELNVVVLK